MKYYIKEARERIGLSQKELANSLGIKPTTFNGYENGSHDPKSEILKRIAIRCDTTVDYLLGCTDNPNRIKNTQLIKDESDAQKSKLIHNYDSLNQAGKDKLVDYSEDLLNNPNYKSEKTYKIKIAARNGRFEEKTLTDSDIEKIKNLPDVDDDL